MTPIAIPQKHTRAFAILTELLRGAGTFYQICERADLSIESKTDERNVRHALDTLHRTGSARLSGVTYSITDRARAAMGEPSAPWIGQVAGPAYRGTPTSFPVKIVRRDEVRP